ncbi:endonuclease domain-containing 1 protein-like [Pelodiscus sinensis]|uniref:endonuclease domain-containing 1 protein-like n=1 Tax=Pelodiscus sinensis TaxID=13735 RepID=UPI003F6D1665
MGPLVLLGFAVLCAGLARAEVVSDFSPCKQFFYGGEAPQGFGTATTANICQRYANVYRFATLYDKSSHIPVWSAYTLDPKNCKPEDPKDENKPTKLWKVEPQLSGLPGADMQTEGELKKNKNILQEKEDIKKKLKESQAIDEDYEKTGYDRGHLNPNAFQCDDGRTATFTLTNAAPMDPCFNEVRWFELEKNLKKQLEEKCLNRNGEAFLVTGAVPNHHKYENYKMPLPNNNGAGRVVVPRYIWTAVCCEHANNNEKFAFAFLGENKPDSILKSMNVSELNEELNRLYGNNLAIRIFKDDCNERSSKAQDVLSAITKELHNEFPNWELPVPANKRPRLGRK